MEEQTDYRELQNWKVSWMLNTNHQIPVARKETTLTSVTFEICLSVLYLETSNDFPNECLPKAPFLLLCSNLQSCAKGCSLCVQLFLGTFITCSRGTRTIWSGDVPFGRVFSSKGKDWSEVWHNSVPHPELIALFSFKVFSWKCHGVFQHVKSAGSVVVIIKNKAFWSLKLLSNK